jgi:Ser/Thr protein kinase RdoA (MazF antagonist)
MSCWRRSRPADGWRGARSGRILGDCHRGNILWTDLGPHFVDLDDCVTGPAIQDLWMLLAGSQQEMRTELPICSRVTSNSCPSTGAKSR